MSNMSKDYFCFESESGKISFLAGVIDVLSDNLSIHCNDFNTMDADIFYIPNQDISLLNDAVKKRVHSYYSLLGGLNKPDTIEKLDFRLTKVDSDPAKYIIKNVSEFQKTVRQSKQLIISCSSLIGIYKSQSVFMNQYEHRTKTLIFLAEHMGLSHGDTFL